MTASLRFSKTRQNRPFLLLLTNSNCKRSSLRSQICIILFLWFSNTVLLGHFQVSWKFMYLLQANKFWVLDSHFIWVVSTKDYVAETWVICQINRWVIPSSDIYSTKIVIEPLGRKSHFYFSISVKSASEFIYYFLHDY